MAQYIERLRRWLIRKLGGSWDNSPKYHLEELLLEYIPSWVASCALRAFWKVVNDPSFKQSHASNLGRNIRRDEAAEWTKLYLKEEGVDYRDSDVHLACEIIYHLHRRL